MSSFFTGFHFFVFLVADLLCAVCNITKNYLPNFLPNYFTKLKCFENFGDFPVKELYVLTLYKYLVNYLQQAITNYNVFCGVLLQKQTLMSSSLQNNCWNSFFEKITEKPSSVLQKDSVMNILLGGFRKWSTVFSGTPMDTFRWVNRNSYRNE